MTTGTPDLAQLRHLLFGKDYDALIALKAQFEQSDKYTASVAAVITEALQQREATDQSLSTFLAPSIEHALHRTVTQNPKHFADVLYPIMGPAIRKSIQQALNEALENFNQLLEQSVSPRSWRWRWDAWRTGQSYAQIALLNTLVYQVEQVFLIHRTTGLLLQHVVTSNAMSKDPEIVSGMLTAIQDFIADSFTVHEDDLLHTLNLGDLTVLIEHGPYAVLAMVVRGTPPSSLRTHLQSVTENIHHQYAIQLQNFQGDTTVFTGTSSLLRQCLLQQSQTKRTKRTPWLAYVVLIATVSALGYVSYRNYRQEQQYALQLQQTLATLKAEPGIVLITTQTQAQGYLIKGLQDPLARSPEQIIKPDVQRDLGLTFDFKPFWSLEPSFVQARADAQETKDRQQHMANQQHIRELTQQITSQVHAFDVNRAEIPNIIDLTQVSRQLQQLFQAAKQENQLLQVTLVGNTDEVGNDTLNQKLAQERAQTIRNALINRGVPAFILQTQAFTQHPRERTVRYQIALY